MLCACVADEMKDSMVARVCAQTEELYTDALRALQRDHLKQLWDRDWFATVSTATLHYRRFRRTRRYSERSRSCRR